ncbi:MAG TPA: sigma-70 family RNA polymerase sigma factor [Solirubrobacteraceae bacterium]
MAGSLIQERELLEAARGGDERAFQSLVEPRHGELHAHCYRMLGSVHDAEDALQEALLRAWRGMRRFEGRSSLRSWLYRIATNACLDAIGRRPRRVLPMDHGPGAEPGDAPGMPLAESVWIEPYPDELLPAGDAFASPEATYEQRESVELAFIAALQHLPARQRAVLILRAVLGFSAAEVADALDTSVASVNSTLQRARRTVDERLPDHSQQATLRTLGDERLREIVERYMDAIQSGDVDAVVALLTADPTWSMPPMPLWYRGREAVGAFLTDHPLAERWRHVPTRANGQLAVGCYMWDDERESFVAGVLDVLTLRDDRIDEVTAFVAPWVYERFGDVAGVMTPGMFRRFGLADELPA